MVKKNTNITYSVHPGEILIEEFLKPLGVTQYRLAKNIGVPARRINEITQGARSITADTALRLSRFFGTSAQFWMNLQSRHDLAISERSLATLLERVVKPLAGSFRVKKPIIAERIREAIPYVEKGS